jgi:hypothetical protein
MRFRIVKSGNRYFPQVGTQGWDGERWFDNWKTIGHKDGYTSIKTAELVCLAHKAKIEPEVVKEFEL